MNREILFRAYAPGKGWIQGFNMVNFHNYFNKGIEPHIYRYDSKWPICEIVLEQYTGLKDCNQTMIFEGDIISGLGETYQVSFQDGAFSVIENGMHHFLTSSQYDVMKVVGNIHYNPELLDRLV